MLGADAELDRVAREVAAQLVAGPRPAARLDGVDGTVPHPAPAGDPIERALPSLSDRYQWVRQVSARALDVSQFGASPALVDRAATHAGFAIAAGLRDESGATPLWLVVLLAARR